MTFHTKSKRIILLATIFLYIMIGPITADGISCFKCFASQPGHKETDLLCSQFDGSARFQVYCPSSTLCRKKTIYYDLKPFSTASVVKAVERDCAPQKRIIPVYNDIDNKWQNKEEIVKTAYEEGCFTGEDRGAPAGPPEYCFCSFHLCNSAQSIELVNAHHKFFIIATLLFARSI